MNEKDYMAGQRAVAANLLAHLLPYLGPKAGSAEMWRLERAGAIAVLRSHDLDVDEAVSLVDTLGTVLSDLETENARLRAALREAEEAIQDALSAWDEPADSYHEGIFGTRAGARTGLDQALARLRAAPHESP